MCCHLKCGQKNRSGWIRRLKNLYSKLADARGSQVQVHHALLLGSSPRANHFQCCHSLDSGELLSSNLPTGLDDDRGAARGEFGEVDVVLTPPDEQVADMHAS